ncbi:MAG TPA: Ig-like domain-containing protein, partial [Patescibacteria group bacterium]|nr:Ig-like domain-containing protein [Patescibacteria group bacterium]
GLLATANTPEHLREEKIFKQAHAILHYVNKDEPLGPAPANPAADPYYSYWEEAVQKWAEKNNIVNQEPPTESDNLHRAEDKPRVNFLSPGDNAAIDSAGLALAVRTDSPRGIAKVEYYLDDKLISLTANAPFNVDLVLPSSIPNGRHRLTAKAYDDLENVGEASITINLERTAFLNINWLQPAQSTTLNAGDFPYSLMINVDDLNKVKKIDFYYKLADETSSTWINYLENPTDQNVQVLWLTPPPKGVYKIYPVVTIPQGGVVGGPEITVSLE